MSRYNQTGDQYLNNSGSPLAGGKLYFYESGTNTPLTIYSDNDETVAIANPVTLPASGRIPNIFYSGTARVVLTDSNDVQLFDQDPVGAQTQFNNFSLWTNDQNYSAYDITRGSNSLFYISLTNDNQGNDPIEDAGSNINWSQVFLNDIYNSEKVYATNALAWEGQRLYISLIDNNLGNQPSLDGGANWRDFTQALRLPYTNTSSGLVATDVQAAIDELKNTIDNLPSSVTYKGQLDVSAGDGSLPGSPSNGDLYLISVGGTITVSSAGGAPTATTVNPGDQIIYNGTLSQWDLTGAVTQAVSVAYNNATSGLAATNVQAAIDEVDADLDTVQGTLGTVTSAEITQVSNIDSVTITNAQWGYVGALDQPLSTTDNVQFAQGTFSGNIASTKVIPTLTLTDTAGGNPWAIRNNNGTLQIKSTLLGTSAISIDGTTENATFNGNAKITGGYSAPTGDGQAYIAQSSGAGAWLYGRGSAYDVSILNRSALPYMRGIANTQNVQFDGNVGIGTAPTSNIKTRIRSATSAGGNYGLFVENSGGTRILSTEDSGTTDVAFNLKVGGNVGIGTSPTSNALQVAGKVEINESTNSGDWQLQVRNENASFNQALARIEQANATETAFDFISCVSGSGGSEKFSVRGNGDAYHSGNVGISRTPDANTKLATNTVFIDNTSGSATGERILLGYNSTGQSYSSRSGTSSAAHWTFVNDNGAVGSIQTSGTTTSYNTTSDPRKKIFETDLPTDAAINAEFDKIWSTFRTFRWIDNPEGNLVWGFDAHACIDAGTDLGTEGQGPRTSNIGDIYKTEVIPAVTEEQTTERQATITKTREVTSIEVINGVPTQVVKTEEYEEPQFEDVQVVDELGNPVTQLVDVQVDTGQVDEDGNPIMETQQVEEPVTHQMPLMETVTETVVVQEEQTIEHRVTPAGVDQAKAVPILLAKIEQLERRLAALGG